MPVLNGRPHIDWVSNKQHITFFISQVYCHALSKDAATADPAEVQRAQRLANALSATGRVQLIVYNSAGGYRQDTGISQVCFIGAALFVLTASF